MNFTFSWGWGGGPFINVFLRVQFDFFRQSSRFHFPPSKQTSFFSGTEIYIPDRVDTSCHLRMNFTFSWGGGPLINIFLRVYFYVFRQTSRLNFCPSKQSSFFSGTEIYIPERVDTSHHLWINFTFLWGEDPL